MLYDCMCMEMEMGVYESVLHRIVWNKTFNAINVQVNSRKY